MSLLIGKKQEAEQGEFSKKIVETTKQIFVVKKSDRVIYVNEEFKKHFEVRGIEEVRGEPKRIERIKSDGLSQKVVSLECKPRETYLYESYALDEGETLDVYMRLDPLYGIQKRNESVSKLKFIEFLKNRLVQDEQIDNETSLLCIRIENYQALIDEFGGENYFEFLNELDMFLKGILDALPHTEWSYDLLVYMIDGASLRKAEKWIDEIIETIDLQKFSHDIAPFLDTTIIALSKTKISNALGLLDRVQAKTLAPHDRDFIYYRKSSYASKCANDSEKAMFFIENLYIKKHPIKLINNYKGLAVNTASKILKMNEQDIYVMCENIQKYTMGIEKKVTLQSTASPKDIELDVKYVDIGSSFAIVTQPRFLEFSAHNREHVRVQCDTRIPISLIISNQSFSGEVFDISVKAIAIKYKNKLTKNIIGSAGELRFNLPLEGYENGMVQMRVFGGVVAVVPGDEYSKIIVTFSLSAPYDGYMLEFLYARQKELIQEIKRIGAGAVPAKSA